MTNKTAFTYAGFDLDLSSLQLLVTGIKKKKVYDREKWFFDERLAESIMECIASGNYSVTNDSLEGIRTYRLLEQLVEWHGYDETGRYSNTARQAIKNLYEDQIAKGIKARKVVLKDIEIFSVASSVKKMAQGIGHRIRKAFGGGHKLVKRAAVFAGAALLGLSAYLLHKNDKESSAHQYAHTQSTPKDLLAANDSAKSSTTKVLTTTDFEQALRQKIEANKAAYRQQSAAEQAQAARIDSIKQEGYNIRLNLFFGEKKKQALVAQVQQKMNAGIFKADGFTAEQLVYFDHQSKVYEGNTIVQKVLSSDKKVSAADNAAFLDYISNIGDFAEKLQARAKAKAKASGKTLNNKSAYHKTSAQNRQKFAQNLKELRQLKNR